MRTRQETIVAVLLTEVERQAAIGGLDFAALLHDRLLSNRERAKRQAAESEGPF
jgi:hypothetical protein